eukprot:SAG31_NODE_11765_length_1000_cov_0.916759_2_plen_286_part_00
MLQLLLVGVLSIALSLLSLWLTEEKVLRRSVTSLALALLPVFRFPLLIVAVLQLGFLLHLRNRNGMAVDSGREHVWARRRGLCVHWRAGGVRRTILLPFSASLVHSSIPGLHTEARCQLTVHLESSQGGPDQEIMAHSADLVEQEIKRRRETLTIARKRAALAGWREATDRKRIELHAIRKAAGLSGAIVVSKRAAKNGCACVARPVGEDMGIAKTKAKLDAESKSGTAGFFARRATAALDEAETALAEAQEAQAQAETNGPFTVRSPVQDGAHLRIRRNHQRHG